jgi:hypothetical protein
MSDRMAEAGRPAGGPRTLAARALVSLAPTERRTMRGVATAELAKLLRRVEQEAAAPYREELRWALDLLDRYDEAAEHVARRARIREMLEEE